MSSGKPRRRTKAHRLTSSSFTTSIRCKHGLARSPIRRLRQGDELSHIRRPLTFSELDGLAFAAERGRFDPASLSLVAGDLGPVFELGLLAKSGLVPWPGTSKWLALDGIAPLVAALSNRRPQWVCPTPRATRVYPTYATPQQEESSWIDYGFAIQYSAAEAGFSRDTA